MSAFSTARTPVLLLAFLTVAVSSCAFAETINIVVDFPVEQLSIKPRGDYDQIELPGCYVISELGAPALPQKSVYVSIPYDRRVDHVEVAVISKQALAGQFTVYPTQPPLPTAAKGQSEFIAPDPGIYGVDTPYPTSIVHLTESGSLAGYNVAGLLVAPFRYKPVSKALSVISSVSLTLHLVPSTPHALAVTRRSKLVRQSCEKRVVRLVTNSDSINPPALSHSASATFDTVDCVIVTGSSYTSQVAPLADWMIKKGYRTEVHTVTSISGSYSGTDTQEKIRNFLKDYYTNKGLGWVILGGDTSVVPARAAYAFDVEGDGYTYDDYLYCDYYYADLDGTWNDDGDSRWGEVSQDNIDMYADLLVGRLPFDTTSEAEAVVEKTLVYEGVGSTQLPTDYQKKLLMFACELDGATSGGDCKDELESYVGIPGDYTITRQYDRDSTSGKTNVINSMNAGYNLINNVGHANYSVMSAKYTGTKEYLYRNDMTGLTNGPRYSVLYTIGCWAAAIDYDCIAERFVLSPSGGGIAFIGNSRFGWYSPGSPGYGPSDAFDQEFFSVIFDYGTYELGEALSDSKQPFVSYCKGAYSGSQYYRWVLYELNLLGSPTTRVWTDTPSSMSASYESTLTVGQEQFDVQVQSGGALQSALVCLYKEDEVFETAETDASGWAHITLSPPATSTGTMHVTVTKHNYLPDRGTAEVQEEGGSSGPELSEGSVSPENGQSSDTFMYSVHYYHADEEAPAIAYVYVDGSPHTMSLASGQAADGDYEYETSALSAGSHSYYFYFEDGSASSAGLPASGDYDGPFVDDTKPSSSCSSPTYSTSQSVSIGFTSSDGGGCGIQETKLYYKLSGGSYSYSGESESGTSGEFSFSLPDGQGTYYFYTIAIDEVGNTEDAPGSADDSTIYDSTKPVSSCSSPTYGSSPINVTFSASDGGTGLANTKLYYSYSGGSYTYSGDESSGGSGSFCFVPTDGEGTYAFYTIATDIAGNSEDAPESADSTTIHDDTKPTSSASSPTYVISLPMTISFTGSDSGSGIASTDLYYSYNSGSYSYSDQTESGTSGDFPFSPTEGDGTYKFYTVAYDNAGNEEDAPENADDTSIYDSGRPESSCSSPEYAYSSPIAITFSSSDSLSGVSTTKLYYRKDGGEYSNSGLSEGGTSGEFSFSPPDGEGTYDFYTLATDNAGNTEQVPESPDDSTTYDPDDNTRPESYCTAPEYANSSPIDVEAFAYDDESGIAETRLYYSFNGGEYEDSGVTWDGNGFNFLPPPMYEVFVAPDGAPDGAGTIHDPKSLESVVSDADLEPGTIVWLGPGEYSFPDGLSQTPYQDGAPDHPIVYTPLCTEKRTRIHGQVSLRGDSTYWIGTELSGTGSAGGISVYGGDDVRIVNNSIHDYNYNGISGWSVGSGHIYYGNLIWGIANDPEDRRGHAIYTQNNYDDYGIKTILNNIMFNCNKFSLHIYCEGGTSLSGYDIRRNITLNNEGDFLIGGKQPTKKVWVVNNYFYEPNSFLRIGYMETIDTTTVADNYIVGSYDAARFAEWRDSNSIVGNTFIPKWAGNSWTIDTYEDSAIPTNNTFDYNIYYKGTRRNPSVRYRGENYGEMSVPSWVALTGFDENATVHEDKQKPSENKIVILCNDYKIKRAHIAIYNWEDLNTVNVDVSSVLSEGDYFRVVDVEDYFGEPVLQGLYDGSPLAIPMADEEFRCFVLSASSFTPPEGEGTYAFYTIATDNAGNVELPPDEPDAVTVYDETAPTSGCSCASDANSSSISISFSAQDETSDVANTKLYYKFNSGSWTDSGYYKFNSGSWTDSGQESSGTSGAFEFTFSHGEGTYHFYTLSTDYAGNSESAKEAPDASTVYDTTQPESSCSCGEFSNSLPIVVEFEAQDDGSGIDSVRLYYSFDGGSFVDSGLEDDGASGAFEFTATEGEGAYNFYTIATDAATNEEQTPQSADCAIIYDSTLPSSSCSSPDYSAAGDISVSFTGEDALSGVSFCDLYYRLGQGEWTSSGLREYGNSGTFEFEPTQGDGTYQFYSVATDRAGNTEGEKSAETSTVRDTQSPSSSCNCTSMTNASSVEVSYSASDELSGLSEVKLYYRYADGEWEYTGQHESAQSGDFIFSFGDGDGHYEFYTSATDAAGNTESPPGQADATVLSDQSSPASNCSSPESATDQFDVSFDSDDGGGSGVVLMDLWFRFSYDQGQIWDPDWAATGMSSEELSGTFAYNPDQGEGTYEFYTIATDEAGNVEEAPRAADSATQFNTEKPTSSASSPEYQNTDPILVSFEAHDSSGIREVQLHYRYTERDSCDWTDYADSGLRAYTDEGTFDFAPSSYHGEGIYQFYTIAVDTLDNVEDPPSESDCQTIFDLTLPISYIFSPEYASAASINSVFVTDDDLSGIAIVRLWYRYSDDNGETFSSDWTDSGAYSEVATGILTFGAGHGDGLYELKTLATDNAGNQETKEAADQQVILDTALPVATVACAEFATELPLRLDFVATDGTIGAGIASVLFWYQFGDETWTPTGLEGDGTSGTVWFSPAEGRGEYQFFAISKDYAGNAEQVVYEPEAALTYDDQVPISFAFCVNYGASPEIEVGYEATGRESGIASVSLFFRFSADGGSSWDPDWTDLGETRDTPFGSFDFVAGYGEGRYEFYTITENNAGAVEQPPSSADAWHIYDETIPSHQLSSPESANSSPIDVSFEVDDGQGGSGLDTIELYFRFEGGDWRTSDLSSDETTGAFSFAPQDGDGTYDFCAVVIDRAGNSTAGSFEVKTDTRFDNAAPSSTLEGPTAVNEGPIQLNYSILETDDLLLVSLLYRFSSDCGETWVVDWTESGETATEMNDDFVFEMQHGEGLYQFKSIAEDTTGNVEQKGSADADTVLDSTQPTSLIEAPDCASSETIAISFVASDAGCSSGIVGVRLFFSSAVSDWQEADVGGQGAEGTIDFVPPDGEGWYQFYSQAEDTAGNLETPGSALIEVTSDTTPPQSICLVDPYVPSSPIEVELQANDAITEPVEIALHYRFRLPDSGWAPSWTETSQTVEGDVGILYFEPIHGQGIYEFCTTSRDACGNAEQVEAERAAECIFDTESPVSLLSGPPTASSGTIRLEFTSADALSGLSSVELLYAFEESDLQPTGLSTTSTTGVFSIEGIDQQGIYTFVCVGTDLAGNDEMPATDNTVVVHVDLDAPSSSAHAPRFANHLPIEISCFATDGTVGTSVSKVELYYRFCEQDWEFSGLAQDATTEATIVFDSDDGNGTYEFFSLAIDAAGNAEPMKTEADSHTLIDSTLPDSFASCEPCFLESPIEVSYVATTGTCELENVALWYRYFDGGDWSEWADSGASDGGTRASIFFSAILGDGTYEFYTLAEDVCGNLEVGPGIADCSTMYDSTAPVCSISVPHYCNSSAVPVEYLCDDGPLGSGVGEIDFWLRKQDEDWWLHPTKGYGAQGATTLNVDLGEGHFDLAAIASDLAGNTSGETSEPDASFALDFLQPTSMSTCPQYVKVAEITVNVHSSDALSGIDSVQLFIRRPEEAWTEAGAPTSATSASMTVSLAQGQGRYEFRARAIDRAGNQEPLSEPTECYVVYDIAPPVANCSADRYARGASADISFEASDEHSGIAEVTLWACYQGGSLAPVDAIQRQSSGSFSYSLTEGEGSYYFAVQAEDEAGNSQDAPTTHQISVLHDATAPQTMCTSPTATKSSPIAVSFTAIDTGAGVKQVKLHYRHNSSSWKDSGETSMSQSGTMGFTPPDGDGEYRFCAVAEDNAGNESAIGGGGTDKTVFDTTPPEVSLSCPEATTTSPIPVQFEAHDALSDVSQVTLYYRFRADGGTRSGTWKSYTYAGSASGTFTFIPAHGFGIYEFSAAGIDSLNNQGEPGDTPLCYVSYETSIPVISPSDVAHDYGEVATGRYDDWVLRIQNSGGSALTISELRTSGDFSCSAMTPITIQSRGTYQLGVRFTPQQVGTRDGWLTITSNDTDTPNCNISLTGMGFEENAQPEPTIVLNSTTFKEGNRLMAQVEAEYLGPSTTADLFVSVFLPGDWHLYCPSYSTIPGPFIASIQLYPGYRLGRTTIIDLILPELAPGDYAFMASFCHEGTLTPIGDATIEAFVIDGPPTLSLSLNGSSFGEGDLMSLSTTIDNPGLAKSVDLYIGITYPTGQTLFYPSLSNDIPEPFVMSIPLQQGETTGPEEVFSITLPGIMPGTYYWLAVLTPAGEFDSFSNIPSCAWTFTGARGGTRSPAVSFARFPKPDDKD